MYCERRRIRACLCTTEMHVGNAGRLRSQHSQHTPQFVYLTDGFAQLVDQSVKYFAVIYKVRSRHTRCSAVVQPLDLSQVTKKEQRNATRLLYSQSIR